MQWRLHEKQTTNPTTQLWPVWVPNKNPEFEWRNHETWNSWYAFDTQIWSIVSHIYDDQNVRMLDKDVQRKIFDHNLHESSSYRKTNVSYDLVIVSWLASFKKCRGIMALLFCFSIRFRANLISELWDGCEMVIMTPVVVSRQCNNKEECCELLVWGVVKKTLELLGRQDPKWANFRVTSCVTSCYGSRRS